MSASRQPRLPRSARSAPTAHELAPRFAALALLEGALSGRSGLEEAASGGALEGLEPRDRAFARALTLAALRRLGPMDAALQPRLRREPPPAVRNLLRLGLAQILALDTPAFAAVATSVEMAKARAGTRPFAGLVNAVLRSLASEPPPPPTPEALAPAWLFSRWRSTFGPARAAAIAARILDEPPTDLTLRRAEDAQALAAELPAQALAGGSLRTSRRGDPAMWPGYADGRWWIQDAAAAAPARLIRLDPGARVVDMCAAPGGKTLQLAAAGYEVTAVDRSASRLRRLEENLSRTGLSARVLAADARTLDLEAPADGVLLDAPCSATGTFRRHPDVLWAVRPSDLAPLARGQAELLDAAGALLRPGGALVYCVCSLEPEEGEDQIAAFLSRRPEFEIDPVDPAEAGLSGARPAGPGGVRVSPDAEEPAGGADGFFMARLRRS